MLYLFFILYLNPRCLTDELKWNHAEIVLTFVMKAVSLRPVESLRT